MSFKDFNNKFKEFIRNSYISPLLISYALIYSAKELSTLSFDTIKRLFTKDIFNIKLLNKLNEHFQTMSSLALLSNIFLEDDYLNIIICGKDTPIIDISNIKNFFDIAKTNPLKLHTHI